MAVLKPVVAEHTHCDMHSMIGTKPTFDVLTRDPDLGLTVLLWVQDLLREAFASGRLASVAVDDLGLAGRPYRNGNLIGEDAHPEARFDSSSNLRFVCSSSILHFRRRRMTEELNQLLALLGLRVETVLLDHLRLVMRQRQLRELARSALSITTSDEPCKFLLRVDDFPSFFADSDSFLRFHEIAAANGLPYLLAVTPFLDRKGAETRLSDREVEILQACTLEGAELALHGFTHRRRFKNYSSELVSMPPSVLREEIRRAEAYLLENDLGTIGFVAPFNSYDAFTVSVLAERFPLLCGGPESVRSLGYRAGPSFLMQSVYVPSYQGAYDIIDKRGLKAFDELASRADGATVPITLHWANQSGKNFAVFRDLCSRLKNRTESWSNFLSRAQWVKSSANFSSGVH
jgi:peptidoglycan/xylan/chitin deacetylase (PgdA/CDA1 family)